MEPGPNLQQRSDSSPDVGAAVSWFRNAREDFQQCALPCSVAADDADDFSALDLERNVVQRPDGWLLAIRLAGGRMQRSGVQAAKRRSKGVGDHIPQSLVGLPQP